MARRCSHCGNNGHNSRTCPDRGVRLFGVRLTNNAMRKTVSMGNLSHYGSNGAGSGAGAGSPNTGGSTPEHSESGAEGYVSDGLVQTSSNDRERKKGVPWTEDEHRLFLIGLQKLGKGDWRGISRNFVTSRTPTQVASHAQKYFIRQSNLSKRKRRSSLFDISAEISNSAMEDASLRFSDLPTSPLQQLTLGHAFTEGFSKPPTIPTSKALDMADPAHKTEAESMEIDSAIHPLWLGLPQIPFGRPANPSPPPNSNIFKPTAKLSTAAIRLEDSSDLTQLSLGICPTQGLNSSKINLKLDQSSRQSAFHLNSSFGSGSVASNEGLNKAISVV